MTVEQFQKIHEINNTTPDTVERLGWIVCLVFDKAEEEVNGWSAVKFLRYVQKVERRLTAKPSKIFKVRLQTDASKINLGQFIDCQHWLKQDPIPVMDLVAASLLKKGLIKKLFKTSHAEDAKRLRQKQFTQILPKVQAFIESMNALIKSYEGLFEPDQEDEEEEFKRKAEPFIELYGWIFSAKQLAEHEGLPLDKVYDIPIIQALNGLSYLKSKAAYDKKKMK